MAPVKICQTQATHNDRSLEMMDSGGNADKSTRNPEPGLLLAAAFRFLTAAFFATTFLAGFPARFADRVAMFQVYQN